MRVHLSNDFKTYASDAARADLIEAFRWWKASSSREFDSPFFGKDCAFVTPTVNGKKYTLWHCHLIPLNNLNALAKWRKDFRWRSRKTSDRYLIYVRQGDDYFLIAVLDDPGAHYITSGLGAQGHSFMAKCVWEAEAFLNGELPIPTA